MNLLAITSPGDVFTGDLAGLKAEFDQLAKQYHPDVNKSPTAHDEFIRLQELYQQAVKQLAEGYWEASGCLQLKQFRARFRRKLDLPIGRMYAGDTHLTFLIEKKYRVLWDNAMRTIRGFAYKSALMKEETARYLPHIKMTVELPNYLVLVLTKTPDLILLRDIPRDLPQWDRHVAWIMSTLHNLRCYLEHAKICHNDISLDTYFISPKFHSGALLGGWWYSCKQGQRLAGVPVSSYDLFSPLMQKTKLADHSLDKELVRAVGRELLGDRGGMKLVGMKAAPLPFINWLRCSTTKSAVEEYALWNKVLEKSYGPKKFIPMNVTAQTIYGGK